MAFAFLLRKNFDARNEIKENTTSALAEPLFYIYTLKQEIFTAETLVKVNTFGDTTMIVPWFSLNCQNKITFTDIEETFETGKLVDE